MALTTLAICDDEGRRELVEKLIAGQTALEHKGTVGRDQAREQLDEVKPQIVWVELAPDPQIGLKLLADLKEAHPEMHFLVSYEKLQADLVKTAMQHGAVEYIDPDGAHRLLPGAIARIERNISSPPPPPPKPTIAPPPPLVVHSTEPHEKVNRDVSQMRSKVSHLEEGWGGLPYWVVPLVAILLLVLVIVLAVIKH